MKNLVVKRILDGAILVTLLAAMSQTASAHIPVPDTASTSVLMAIACAGLTAIRRFKR